MQHSKFVICIENSDYPASLEKRKIYGVVPDRDADNIEHIRVIDESGDDYLYPASLFIDARLPKPVESPLTNAAHQA